MLEEIARILPDKVEFECLGIDLCSSSLYWEEELYIEGAVYKRRKEFTAGRECARRMLQKLQIAACAIPAGPSREPVWPAGIAASITHQDDLCIAAGATLDHISLLGIDLATTQPLESALIRYVCTPSEAALARHSGADFPMDPYKLIFSMKEAVFKCLYPVTRKIFDFTDVSIEVDCNARSASVELLAQAIFAPLERAVDVRFCLADGYVFTVAWVGPARS